MSIIRALARAVTLRDLGDQIAESKRQIAESHRKINVAEEQIRSAPKECVRRVLQSSMKE